MNRVRMLSATFASFSPSSAAARARARWARAAMLVLLGVMSCEAPGSSAEASNDRASASAPASSAPEARRKAPARQSDTRSIRALGPFAIGMSQAQARQAYAHPERWERLDAPLYQRQMPVPGEFFDVRLVLFEEPARCELRFIEEGSLEQIACRLDRLHEREAQAAALERTQRALREQGGEPDRRQSFGNELSAIWHWERPESHLELSSTFTPPNEVYAPEGRSWLYMTLRTPAYQAMEARLEETLQSREERRLQEAKDARERALQELR